VKSVFVTGGSGFIGRRVVRALRERGYDVIAPAHADLSLFDEDAVARFVREHRPTALVHLAWCTQPGSYLTDPINERWAAASERLVTEFAAQGGSFLLQAGSCAVKFAPQSAYAVAKNRLWQFSQDIPATGDIRAALGRIYYAYGPGEARERFLSDALLRLSRGCEVHIRQPGRTLDYVFVDDVAEAFALIVERGAIGEFDIGIGMGVSLRSLVEKMLSITGADRALVTLGDSEPCDPDAVADSAAIRGIGWVPQVSIARGISMLWQSLAQGK
jgi:nucleoside-diphosphate-sugar epimerase